MMHRFSVTLSFVVQTSPRKRYYVKRRFNLDHKSNKDKNSIFLLLLLLVVCWVTSFVASCRGNMSSMQRGPKRGE